MIHEINFPSERGGVRETWRVEISSEYGPIRAWYAGPLSWDMVHQWYTDSTPPVEEYPNIKGSLIESVEYVDRSTGMTTIGWTADKEAHLINGADEIEYWSIDYSSVNGAEAYGKMSHWRGEKLGDPKSYFDADLRNWVPTIDLLSGEYTP
jgi:hypothetical protein